MAIFTHTNNYEIAHAIPRTTYNTNAFHVIAYSFCTTLQCSIVEPVAPQINSQCLPKRQSTKSFLQQQRVRYTPTSVKRENICRQIKWLQQPC